MFYKCSSHKLNIPGCPYSTDPSGNAITFDRDVRSLNDIPRLKRQSKQIFTMQQYTPRERSEIVEIYIQQKKSIVKTQRAFKNLKNVRSAPSKNTIKRLYEKFSTGEALSNPKRPNKSRPRRSAENIANIPKTPFSAVGHGSVHFTTDYSR